MCGALTGSTLRPTDTVVTQAAVRRPRRPEDLAGEAVLELDCLPVDEDLSGTGGGLEPEESGRDTTHTHAHRTHTTTVQLYIETHRQSWSLC